MKKFLIRGIINISGIILQKICQKEDTLVSSGNVFDNDYYMIDFLIFFPHCGKMQALRFGHNVVHNTTKVTIFVSNIP